MNSEILKNFLVKEKIYYKENVSFKELTTYKSGGIAKYVVFPKDIFNLQKIIEFVKKNKIKYKIFGNGSNILASDDNYEGVIIKLIKINKELFEREILTLGSGCDLIRIANKYSLKGYSGLEFACGIPGTIGGAIYMNAGAYLRSMSEIVDTVSYLNEKNEIKVINNSEISFGYRESIFKYNNWIILEVKLLLKKGKKEEIIALLNDRRKRRILSQPLEYPSAGSVFRNPNNSFAGELIEKSGLKGINCGQAEISIKHANFIVNKGNANSTDIRFLIKLAQKEVLKKYKIKLLLEQEMFNWR